MKDVDNFTVESRDGLAAAVKAAAHLTYADAREHPFEITLGPTKYTFKEGVTERRADQIAANIRKITKKAFEVTQ